MNSWAVRLNDAMKIPKPALSLSLVAALFPVGDPPNASASTTNLVPVADTGIREPDSGSGTLSPIPVGVSDHGTPRNRALFKFSLTNIPANAVITAASLKLVVIKTSRPAASFDLNRLLKDWDETQATWVARLTSTPWVAGGGLAGNDYASSPTATAVLGASGTASAFSSTEMVSDLQMWLNNPGTNFGWILLAAGEPVATGKQIASREDAVNTPILTVEYTAPEPPAPAVPPTVFDTALDGNQIRFSFIAESNRTYAVEFRDSFTTTNWSVLTNIPAQPANTTIHFTNTISSVERFFRTRTP